MKKKQSNGAAADYHELIDLALIDEPAEPERETMEPEELAELAGSIADVGLIEPLIVKPRADRFETIAGHRRLLACRIAKYSPVPCIVKASNHVDHTAILVHENAYREDVNPVEEARFYDRILRAECQGDVDQLVLKVRRRRTYVEDRLLLLQLDGAVLEALHAKKITLGVARELGKVPDPKRMLVLLDVAITQGATARQIAEWRRNAESMAPIGSAPESPDTTDSQPQLVPPTTTMKCFFCDSEQFPYMMEFLYLHKYCKAALENMLRARAAEVHMPPES